MKKLYSLIRACMSSDMQLFKINGKKNNHQSKIMLTIFISLCFMFNIWIYANMLFEKLAPMNLQNLVLSLFVFAISFMTIIEGVYKSGSLIFNCRDDDLLLSLPIKRKTILFVRIFKFYMFEFLFNSLFLIPFIVAYIRWANILEWTYFLTSFVMIITLPIIPIIISCIIGAILSSISSRFKYKNLVQTVVTFLFLIFIIYISFSLDTFLEYVIQNASSINDAITKIYYPAGVYANLVVNFNYLDLIIYILINVFASIIAILILSKYYFKINSRLKKVLTTKIVNSNKIVVKSRRVITSLIRKEMNTFLKTPVFIINAGFGLILFILGVIVISIKYDSILPILVSENGLNIEKELITNNMSIVIFILISITSYMTSITNSVISLEGRNINILKSLPLKTKTILMSKVYSCILITTPILFIGNIILFIRFKIGIIEALLLMILSILIPLVSHFIGILVNLKYPKLDAQNATEIVKQSTSSFIAVMIGMVLLIVSVAITLKLLGKINAILILFLFLIFYIIVDILLYFILINKGVRKFDELSI